MTDQQTRKSRADVVVGYDGSPAANAAVAWAAEEAALLGSKLRIISCTPYSPAAVGHYAAPSVAELVADARSVAAEGQRVAVKHLDPADISLHPLVGSSAGALVDVSGAARLTVVGTRGRGGVASALLGSVSFAVTAHAHGTVVVVPAPPDDDTGQGPVVVGADGSDSSQAALRFAGDYAARHDRSLVVLAAWVRPVSSGLQAASWARLDPSWLNRPEQEARDHADTAAQFVRSRHPQLDVETSVIEGAAGPRLAAATHTACLVVVGTRGLGGFDRLLLGSVSRATIHRTHCPVAVVRD